MAEDKNIEREYVIPLRREWMKVANYKRTRRSVKAIKTFIAKHMRVQDRDVDKVKLDVYLNNEMWFRGAKSPPSKVKVRARKEGDIVKVELAEVPDFVKFAKEKQERKHKKIERKKSEVKEEKKVEQSEQERKEEIEKEKSVAQAQEKAMDKLAKEHKHVIRTDKTPQIQRKALKK